MSDVTQHDYRFGDEYLEEARQDEIPVNPYSLMEAVNGASGAARNSWVGFLAIMTYLLIAVAGVNHKNLLLNEFVPLPLLQVGIDLVRFFMFAPIVLVFLHFGLLVQHVMLARKVLEFDSALRPLEATERRNHPLRLELHSYFFTQALAGPDRSWLFGFFLHTMTWITVVVMPVFLLLFIQIMFLPYHDEWITWSHRVALMVDISILLLIGVFLRRPETGFWVALWRTLRYHPGTFVLTSILMAGSLLFSFFVATIPDEALDRFTRSLPGMSVSAVVAEADMEPRRIFTPTAFLFESSVDGATRKFVSPFTRNLVVNDLDLVADKDTVDGEVTVILRDRDLRHAVLDRSDLHGADLTGANLRGASLVGTDLRRAKLSCADITAVLTLEVSREQACTLMEGADFTRANLERADLRLSFLAGAHFDQARLISADLRYADLVGADFSGADMRRSDLSGGVDATGTNFLGALLHGVDFSGAKLAGADFSSAALQASQFTLVQAYGTNFQGAELDAANMAFARLHGADLSGATLKGTDLSAANVWLTEPPRGDDTEIAALADVKLRELSERDLATLREQINAARDPRVKRRLETALAGLIDDTASQTWANSAAADLWRSNIANANQGPGYANALTNYLTRLSCQVRWSDGSVATGVIQRALSPTFKGDIALIYSQLTNPRCPASASLSNELVQKLSAAVERRDQANGITRDATGAIVQDGAPTDASASQDGQTAQGAQ